MCENNITCKVCGKKYVGVVSPKSKEPVCHRCRVKLKQSYREFMDDLETHDDIIDKKFRRDKYEPDPPRDGNDYV